MYSSLRLVRGCRVINSSGCHRYGYWNEQCLFDGRPETGWCTPSRAVPQPEFLEISIPPYSGYIVAMRVLSRRINENSGFPVKFALFAREGEEWLCCLKVNDLANRADYWHEWTFPQIRSNLLKLDVQQVALRPEGKYFLQFMCLEFYYNGDL
jgi:hypothetical protein